MALAALSTQPELARKLSVAVLLAPVAFTTHVASSPIRALADMDTAELFTLLGSREFLPSRKVNHDAWSRFCAFMPSVRPSFPPPLDSTPLGQFGSDALF
jgi:hypothetical protein